MVNWIITCVTTSAFSICVNGGVHGYFKRGRGLRQGDPLSPYLFTLVMEVFTLIMANNNVHNSIGFKYHVGCSELKITHICFAGDLLVLCYGNVESVEIIKKSLFEFSQVSGLLPNMSKSTIFFGNIDSGEQMRILEVLPFQVGRLPVKYLGVPLITKRLSLSECKQVVDKVKTRIGNWKNKFLSFAGRLQLIASVLSYLQVYWASFLLIPKHIVKDIERIFKGFLWCQGELTRGKAKIAWKVVCRTKDQGGLGLKSLGVWNEALLVKHIWNIVNRKDNLWVKWVHIVRIKDRSFWELEHDYSDSWMWKNLLDLRDKVKYHIWHIVENGRNTSLRYDWWCTNGRLSSYISRRKCYEARLSLLMSVYDMIENGRWKWPNEWVEQYPFLQDIPDPAQRDKSDKIVWKMNDGTEVDFSVHRIWEDFRGTERVVNWNKIVWFSQGIPSHMFIMWLAVHERLQTQDRIKIWNKDDAMKCSLCNTCEDSHEHLFFQCQFSSYVWQEMIKNSTLHTLIMLLPMWWADSS